MDAVIITQGDIFDGGADLTVLPCSAKGTYSSSTKVWLEKHKIPEPLTVASTIRLGDVIFPVPFGGPPNVTKFVAFAASVFNDRTTPEAIEKIGRALGTLTAEHPEVQIVEVPLLGTGAGRLGTREAGTAIAKGFKSARGVNATLHIFVLDTERYEILKRAISGGFWSRVLDSLHLRPGFMGISVDLKKLLKK